MELWLRRVRGTFTFHYFDFSQGACIIFVKVNKKICGSSLVGLYFKAKVLMLNRNKVAFAIDGFLDSYLSSALVVEDLSDSLGIGAWVSRSPHLQLPAFRGQASPTSSCGFQHSPPGDRRGREEKEDRGLMLGDSSRSQCLVKTASDHTQFRLPKASKKVKM